MCIRDRVNGTAPLPCGQIVHLESETSVTLTGTESKTEIAEVYYLVGLIDKDSGDLVLEGDGYFTINNPDADRAEENSPVSANGPEEPIYTSTKNTVTPIYGWPVSDPNGLVDLTFSSFIIGYLTDEKIFLRSQAIDNDFRGAVRFTVKNIGSKTSDEWQFIATLPSGRKVTSAKQTPLRPNEEATITLGFSPGNRLGIKTATIRAYSRADYNQKNNQFTWPVPIVD